MKLANILPIAVLVVVAALSPIKPRAQSDTPNECCLLSSERIERRTRG